MGRDSGLPETSYATIGGDRVAYQVFGAGDVDLLYVSPLGDCIDLRWEWPSYAGFLRRLAARSRVISFDPGGTGASDAPSGAPLPSWERWADEARCVLDAVGSKRAVVLGSSDGGPIAIMFAAAHPDRCRGLILADTAARLLEAPDYPWGIPAHEAAQGVAAIPMIWGTEAFARFGNPDASKDPAFRAWCARNQRLSLSPKGAAALMDADWALDVRAVLGVVRVPTLVLHREGGRPITPAMGRYLADRVDGARFVLLPGRDPLLYAGPVEDVMEPIEEFLGHGAPVSEPDRALATILFTDIVGSTQRAAELGDGRWRYLLDTHDAVSRAVLEQHAGRLIKTTGDGILATFDGPGRAVRCAVALRDALRPIGLDIRVGLHAGEVELRHGDIAGIGVHIAARVLGAAEAGEILVSAAVPILVAGSDLRFEERGDYELKGIAGLWKLYAVIP